MQARQGVSSQCIVALAGCRLRHAATTAQVLELQGTELKLQHETEKASSFKCATFSASSLAERHLATGNYEGKCPNSHTTISVAHDSDALRAPKRWLTCLPLHAGWHAGELQVWDMERWDAPVYSAAAHSKIIHSLDGCGGQVTMLCTSHLGMRCWLCMHA